MQYALVKATIPETANQPNDLATFADDVFAFRLAEQEAVEILTKQRYQELHAERMRAHQESVEASRAPRVVVKLRESYGRNVAGEICSFPPEVAEQLVRRGQADKLGIAEEA